MAVPLPVRWQTPDASLWLLLIVMGVIASLGQLLLTRAYACAPAAQVGPFSYATVVFAAVAGWVLWGEVLDAFFVRRRGAGVSRRGAHNPPRRCGGGAGAGVAGVIQ